MQALLDLEILRATGWALMHFLWQGLVLALGTALLLHASRRLRAAHRYLMAVGLLALAPALLAGTAFTQLRAPAVATTETPVAAAVAEGGVPAPLASDPAAGSRTFPTGASVLAGLALLWLAIVLAATLRLALACRTAGRLGRAFSSHANQPKERNTIEAAFDRARSRMGLDRPVALGFPVTGASPVVFGCFRVVVLFPVSLASGLTPNQLELLLAHEIAHVRRHDFLINVVQSWIEQLFFFHPGIRWMSRRIRLEREIACDEAVVATYDRPVEYGEALAQLALLNPPPTTVSLAASSSDLALRIRHLFGTEATDTRLPHRAFVALAMPAMLIITLAGAQVIAAQSAMRRLLDAPATRGVVSQHEHRNRFWARGQIVTWQSPDGVLWTELRLGRRARAIRFVAQLLPRDGADTAVVSLRAELRGWWESREVTLLPSAGHGADVALSDSLLAVFLRERGLNADSRGAALVVSSGVTGLLRETANTGNPNVRAAYLKGGVATASNSTDRARLVREALSLTNNSVAVAWILRTAMRAARSPAELAAVTQQVSAVEGEAERLELLLEAVRLSGGEPTSLRNTIARIALTLPGNDARHAVERALGTR